MSFERAASPRGWPLLGNLPELLWSMLMTRGNFIRAIQRMLARHQAKTLLFKIGPRRLVLTVDPAVAHQVLVEDTVEYPKTDWEERVLKPVMDGGLIILQGDDWKTHRHALASCFGASRMPELMSMTQDATQTRMAHWQGTVNLSHEMHCIVNDVMFRFFLDGHRLDSDQEVPGGVDTMARHFEFVEKGLEDRVFDPLFFSDRLKEKLGLARRFREAIRFVTWHIHRKVMSADLTQASNTDSPLESLLRKLPTQDSVVKEVRTTMGAGATTAHMMTWVCQLLAKHPEAQERVRREIQEHLGPGGATDTLARIESMPFLNGVIQEGLRLYPPAPFLIRQTDEAKPGMIFVSVYAMHRDPEFWERPDDFVPERWLNIKSTPAAYVPFGMGPRVCVGKRFALLEAKVVLSEVLRRFRLEPGLDKDPAPKFTVLTRPEREVRLPTSAIGE